MKRPSMDFIRPLVGRSMTCFLQSFWWIRGVLWQPAPVWRATSTTKHGQVTSFSSLRNCSSALWSINQKSEHSCSIAVHMVFLGSLLVKWFTDRLPQQAAVVFCAQKQDATPSFTVQSSRVTQTASSWTSAKFRICLKMTDKGCGKQKWLLISFHHFNAISQYDLW